MKRYESVCIPKPLFHERISMKRLIPLLLSMILLLAACAPAWNGYETTDLSKFISLGNYKGLTYTQAEINITDEDVEKSIDAIQIGRAHV